MLVNIVKEKTGCDMTIEELVEETKVIGFENSCFKYFLHDIGGVCKLIRADGAGGSFYTDDGKTKLDLFRTAADEGTFHVFPTANKLYLWLAEQKG